MTNTPAPFSETTAAMILSLAASGMAPDQIEALYADIEPAEIQRLLRKALRKAPMFLES